QPQDLELAWGQPVVELLARAGTGQHVEHAVGDGARDHTLAGDDGVDAGHDRVLVGILQQIAAGARAQRLEHVAVGFERGQDQHLRLGRFLGDALGGLDPVDAGHLQVHQDHVRPELGHQLDGLLAVGGRAHDLHPRIFVEEPGKAVAEERLVVGDDDAGDPRFDRHESDSRGTVSRTFVPRGELSTLRPPPLSVARSRMPTIPKREAWRFGWAGKPLPSSEITTTAWSPPWTSSRTRVELAWACSTTLFSGS